MSCKRLLNCWSHYWAYISVHIYTLWWWQSSLSPQVNTYFRFLFFFLRVKHIGAELGTKDFWKPALIGGRIWEFWVPYKKKKKSMGLRQQSPSLLKSETITQSYWKGNQEGTLIIHNVSLINRKRMTMFYLSNSVSKQIKMTFLFRSKQHLELFPP